MVLEHTQAEADRFTYRYNHRCMINDLCKYRLYYTYNVVQYDKDPVLDASAYTEKDPVTRASTYMEREIQVYR